MFTFGRTSVEDDKCSGQTAVSITDINIAIVQEKINGIFKALGHMVTVNKLYSKNFECTILQQNFCFCANNRSKAHVSREPKEYF